ncbi:MAG: PDZ domain-containing protein [bacterium]
MSNDSSGQRVTSIAAGGTADSAHVQVGDYLVSIGGTPVRDANWARAFRAQFNGRTSAPIDVVVRRGGVDVTLAGTLKTVAQVDRVQMDPRVSPKAVRIRHAMLANP